MLSIQKNHFQHMPTEVLSLVANSLKPREFWSFRSVNKQIHQRLSSHRWALFSQQIERWRIRVEQSCPESSFLKAKNIFFQKGWNIVRSGTIFQWRHQMARLCGPVFLTAMKTNYGRQIPLFLLHWLEVEALANANTQKQFEIRIREVQIAQNGLVSLSSLFTLGALVFLQEEFNFKDVDVYFLFFQLFKELFVLVSQLDLIYGPKITPLVADYVTPRIQTISTTSFGVWGRFKNTLASISSAWNAFKTDLANPFDLSPL